MTLRTGQFAANGTMTVQRISVGVKPRRQKPALTFGTQSHVAIQSGM